MRPKSEVVHQTKEDGKTFHFCEFDGLLSLEERRACETPPDIHRSRVVLWGDNVKDEEGYRAVLSEARASASQMAVAKFLDTISMLPGVTGETRDAILACTQVKMIEAPRLLRSVSKCNKACDSRLLSLMNYINQTKNYRQLLYSRIEIQGCKLGFWQDVSFAGGLRDSKINVRNFAQRIWMIHTRLFTFRRCARSKDSFWHSSAESEIV